MLFKNMIRCLFCEVQKLKIKVNVDIWSHSRLWAEESGFLSSNQAEWSYGNGGTGTKGLPLEAGNEITHMFFQADNHATNASVTVACIDNNAGASTVPLCTITLANAADGGGQSGNSWKIVELPVPIVLPVGTVLGFLTVQASGSISDAIVGVKLRHNKQTIMI